MTPIRKHILNALADEGLAADQALLLADTFEAELSQMVADGRLRLSGKLAGPGREVSYTGEDPQLEARDEGRGENRDEGRDEGQTKRGAKRDAA